MCTCCYFHTSFNGDKVFANSLHSRTPERTLDLRFCCSFAFSSIQTHFGSTFLLFLRFFVHPNALWIYVFAVPSLFRTSKHTLDLHFCCSFAFSYTQTHFGSTFLLFLRFFVHPNALWIYVFAVPSLFRTSKHTLDLRFCCSFAFSSIQTHFGSTFL